MKADSVQGYFYAKPAAADEALANVAAIHQRTKPAIAARSDNRRHYAG
jgi:predicted signal transduction protein with EAL and GGDEF domain